MVQDTWARMPAFKCQMFAAVLGLVKVDTVANQPANRLRPAGNELCNRSRVIFVPSGDKGIVEMRSGRIIREIPDCRNSPLG